jgi:hypothetical protein
MPVCVRSDLPKELLYCSDLALYAGSNEYLDSPLRKQIQANLQEFRTKAAEAAAAASCEAAVAPGDAASSCTDASQDAGSSTERTEAAV